MTMRPWLMLAAGTVLAGAALAGCGAGGSGTVTGSRTAGPSGHAAGSATPAQTPATSSTSAAASAGATARSAAVAACTTSDLRVSLNGSASDSLKDAGTILDLANSSRHACALDGYPGLSLLDSRHQVLHTVTHRGGTFWTDDTGRRLVDLAPGQTAYASLAWTHTGSSAVSASYLEVTPPNSATHLAVSFRHLVDGGNLDVTALTDTVSFSNGI
jgi:Domain of unknown function (DUF4232)